MTEIYIVRHCESLTNRTATFAGVLDVDITAKGRQQLDCLSEFFKDIKLDEVVSSPLIRTKKTAEAVNKYSGAPVILDKRIIEMNVGSLEGKPVTDMDDEQARCWNTAPHLFSTDAECMDDVYLRVTEAFSEIVERNNNKTVAIATHGGVVRNIMRFVKGYAPEGLKEIDWGDNAGVYHILYSDGKYMIDYESRTDFLPDDLLGDAVSDWVKPI